MIEKIMSGFNKVYKGKEDVRVYFAPGRVNLIGEHTDYNGGHVFPCALNIGTYGAVRIRDDGIINLFSENMRDGRLISLDERGISDFSAGGWENYVKGVICAFRECGFSKFHGMDIYIYGNLPAGSGLSSSASLEVLTGTILKEECGFDISMKEIAILSQTAENKYNGCNCGIMDQFVSALGEENTALFIDTERLEYKAVPLNLNDASIVIANSKVKHRLASSDYNRRRKECEEALHILQEVVDIKNLCELEPDSLSRYENIIKDETLKRRVRHVVSENYRTLQGVSALMNSDIARFGKLMLESHASLRDDYEVSCRELDILVEAAAEIPGVTGARMTGGGFGGCTVNIVHNSDLEYFKNVLYETYYKKTGIETEFYTVLPGRGAGRII